MSVASMIINEGKGVDWGMLIEMQDRNEVVYQHALEQLEDAGILSKKRDGNFSGYGLEGLYFTNESNAEVYSTLMKNRIKMLLTCRC